MKPYDANLRQLEIWKKTIGYEIKMMAPRSKEACEEFAVRLLRFEAQLQAEASQKTEEV